MASNHNNTPSSLTMMDHNHHQTATAESAAAAAAAASPASSSPASPPPQSSSEKQKSVSRKQFTWFLLLKAQRAFSILSWLSTGSKSLVSKIRHRVASSNKLANQIDDVDLMMNRGKLYKFIRFCLIVSVVGLLIEAVAHWEKWNEVGAGLMQQYRGGGGIGGDWDWEQVHHNVLHWSYVTWIEFRSDYVAPVVVKLSSFCVVLFLIQSFDRFVLCLGFFWMKYKRIKPVLTVEDGGIDLEDPNSFPMVLIQIPMCNEKEVYEQSIAAACQLDWPRDRILVQVLDDSDDENLQSLIKNEVLSWSEKGANIIYRHRINRTGYKAGNLKSAMSCDYVQDYEFVAIFDADFQPNPDFLKLTIPHFKGNPDLALVQARWAFVNKDENLLTRLQNINLCFHFEVEQQVNGQFLNFFGFNGTAGVWRIKALEDSGGWLERTTVEDMDIAVRAHLNGWKFIFLNDVRVLCELPESYEAYKKQQHRWHSGPMQLFRLCFPAILKSKISAWKKANLIFLFFLLRKLILPFYSFTLFCIILPLTMFIPEAELPNWVICYVPVVVSLLSIIPAPKSFPFLVPYLLFENTMSVTKFNAMVSGLFQLGSSYEWVVTKKTGRASESDLVAMGERESKALLMSQHESTKIQRRSSESGLELLSKMSHKHLGNGHHDHDHHDEATTTSMMSRQHQLMKKRKRNRIYRKELALAFLLLSSAARSLMSAHGLHFYFLLFQGVSFLVVGLDLIGEQID